MTAAVIAALIALASPTSANDAVTYTNTPAVYGQAQAGPSTHFDVHINPLDPATEFEARMLEFSG